MQAKPSVCVWWLSLFEAGDGIVGSIIHRVCTHVHCIYMLQEIRIKAGKSINGHE